MERPFREIGHDRLPLKVLVNLQVVARQAPDETAILVDDPDVQLD